MTPIPVIAAGLVSVGDCDGSSRPSRTAPASVCEVQHLHSAVLSHFDVGRLQIAMDDALLVRRFERFGDLSCDRQRLVDRHRALRNAVRQGRASTSSITSAFAGRVFEPVDGRDVWVIERGEDFGFALKAGKPVRVCRDRRGEDLQCDLALQSGVRRAIHLPHAARAER